jgi:hypothetical protein
MDLTNLDRKLLAVLEQKAPVFARAILPLVLDSDPDEEEREILESEGLESLLTEKLPTRRLLSFDWESWGAPTSSSDSMFILTVDTHHFLCLPDDGGRDGLHPLIILDATEVEGGQVGVSGMVRRALPVSTRFWATRLPTATANMAPDLLTGESVKEAYRSLAAHADFWDSLLADLAELTSDVTPSQRLAGVMPQWIDDSNLDAQARTRLFEQWFALTYSEGDGDAGGEAEVEDVGSP